MGEAAGGLQRGGRLSYAGGVPGVCGDEQLYLRPGPVIPER